MSNQNTKRCDLHTASKWASEYLGRDVSVSNISYLIQYGRITKYGSNGSAEVDLTELESYYKSQRANTKNRWKDEPNWTLAFDQYTESQRTKHVHRLHPYKGKFIPQLVEYFIDSHTDNLKTQQFFKPGDIILDPFCGSGTALIQANELGIHAIGIDISAFNALISNVKLSEYKIVDIEIAINEITRKLHAFQRDKHNVDFEIALLERLNEFNGRFFPSPEYKIQVRKREINEQEYSRQKEQQFLPVYYELIKQYNIKLKQASDNTFIEKWFIQPIRDEIELIMNEINAIENEKLKNVLRIILSRTMRSCRATTHADLASLKEPILTTYYCKKHGKICKPLFTISNWWSRYSKDTIKRLSAFSKIKTKTSQQCLVGDSRTIDLVSEIKSIHPEFSKIVETQKIKGIFTSPPYIGLIDYHEQHAYAYDLFEFERKDNLEIGPLFKGSGKEAQESYIMSIAQVLKNCKAYMQEDYDVFIVANDKFNVYQQIANISGMQIANRYERPVLNRVEMNRSAYSETIFHLKERL